MQVEADRNLPESKRFTHVVYHGHCFDGFGSAWAARKKLGDEAEYIPSDHGGDIPEFPQDAYVIMMDFSYTRENVVDLKKRVKRLCILDHHKSAMDQLQDLDDTWFDMDESGATLSWKFFHGEPVPPFIAYLRDHDLYKFELENSEAVRAWIRSYPMEFGLWDGMSKKLDNSADYPSIVKQGRAIIRDAKVRVNQICSQATLCTFDVHEGVPVVNSTTDFSEVGVKLLELYPDAPFAAYYFDRADGQRQFGLRSREDFDCSVVAKLYGGGGHPRASGFQVLAPNPEYLIPVVSGLTKK